MRGDNIVHGSRAYPQAFDVLSQGPGSVLGCCQGWEASTRGAALGSGYGKSFVLFWDVLVLWPVAG